MRNLIFGTELSVIRRRDLDWDLKNDAAARWLRATPEEREQIRVELEEEHRARLARAHVEAETLLALAPVAKKRDGHYLHPSDYERIRSLARAGLSQREIAKRMNVSRPTIARALERDRKKVGRPRADGKLEKVTMAEKVKQNRERRFLKNVSAWCEEYETKAKVVAVGRDLDPKQWAAVLLNPKTEDERAARADFVFWLRHVRSVAPKWIGVMLDMTPAEVEASIAGRIVPTKRNA